MQPEATWIADMRMAVDRLGSIKALADHLGYSRTAVSLVLSGKYQKDTAKIEAAVRARLAQVPCPFLGEAISGGDCVQHQDRAEPAAGTDEFQHWRACMACRVGLGKVAP
ncbi:hypothetical protein [Niveispirillum sp. KHB5.9]|uniref:hypothetical protein n=1 Tax=Niveispirillum sp. KHB5.9 TaxID=3400269 RepID=UPI003A866AEC